MVTHRPVVLLLSDTDEGTATRDEIVVEILKELESAEAKFPTWPDDPIAGEAIVAEESGELTRAANHFEWEPHKYESSSLYKEATQTAAMAIRFLMYLKFHKQGQA